MSPVPQKPGLPSTWFPGLSPWGLDQPHGSTLLWADHLQKGLQETCALYIGRQLKPQAFEGGVNNMDFRQHCLKPGLSMMNTNHILLFLYEQKLVWLTLSMLSFLMNQAFAFVKNLLGLL